MQKLVKRLWEFLNDNSIRSAAPLAADGTLYFGSQNHKLYALDSHTGGKKWEFQTGGLVSHSPAIGHDGVYTSDLKTVSFTRYKAPRAWI